MIRRFIDRGAIVAAYVGVGMAITMAISFLLVIPIGPAYVALSVPAMPRQRSWVRVRLKLGRRSLRNELVRLWVCHPVRPGFLACSKS